VDTENKLVLSLCHSLSRTAKLCSGLCGEQRLKGSAFWCSLSAVRQIFSGRQSKGFLRGRILPLVFWYRDVIHLLLKKWNNQLSL